MLEAVDQLGTYNAENTPFPTLLMDAKVAGRLPGEDGRAAATKRSEGSVTMLSNLSRAVIENELAVPYVAMLKPLPLN
jgi:hypothetical protein